MASGADAGPRLYGSILNVHVRGAGPPRTAGRQHLQTQFFDRVFHPRRATTRATLQHAIDRGEVRPDIDMEFVLDALAAPIYFRALFQHAAVDRQLFESTVDLVLAGITT